MAGAKVASDERGLPLKGLIIVPAFNESATVGRVVTELSTHYPEMDVLVIDDGSTDGTEQEVPPPASIVRLPFNMGIGAAMQTGYRYAQMHGYDLAVQVDADGQHPPQEVGHLVRELAEGSADMVIGSRFLDGQTYSQTLTRRIGSGILRGLILLLTGRRITDCTSGFRAVNRKVLDAFAHWYPEDYPEPEVVLLLHRWGCTVREVPVTMSQRNAGRTSIPLTKGLFYVAKVSVCLVLDVVRHPWPNDTGRQP